MARPRTRCWDARGEIDIGDRTIPNYDKFDLAPVPMARAFANSCNTTFAELASRMPPTRATVAASQYGIGPDYTIDRHHHGHRSGAPDGEPRRTHRGRVPARARSWSPFGMALAAATVAAGRPRHRALIVRRRPPRPGITRRSAWPMPTAAREMMRLVVTNGTARDIWAPGTRSTQDR